jgi:hypothetical protein
LADREIGKSGDVDISAELRWREIDTYRPKTLEPRLGGANGTKQNRNKSTLSRTGGPRYELPRIRFLL